MKVTVQHDLTRDEARRRIESMIRQAQQRFGHAVSDVQQQWESDFLRFDFKTAGMKVNGEVEVTDREATVDIKLPLLAMPLEPKIRQMITAEAERALA
jgi:putative polyhydroxyalkanoate system protein